MVPSNVIDDASSNYLNPEMLFRNFHQRTNEESEMNFRDDQSRISGFTTASVKYRPAKDTIS